MAHALDRHEIAIAPLDSASRTQASAICRQDVRHLDLHNRLNDMSNLVTGIKSKSDMTEKHLHEACGNIISQYVPKLRLNET